MHGPTRKELKEWEAWCGYRRKTYHRKSSCEVGAPRKAPETAMECGFFASLGRWAIFVKVVGKLRGARPTFGDNVRVCLPPASISRSPCNLENGGLIQCGAKIPTRLNTESPRFGSWLALTSSVSSIQENCRGQRQ